MSYQLKVVVEVGSSHGLNVVEPSQVLLRERFLLNSVIWSPGHLSTWCAAEWDAFFSSVFAGLEKFTAHR